MARFAELVEELQARSSLSRTRVIRMMPSPGIESILHELGQGLARVGLTQREPADRARRHREPASRPFSTWPYATVLLARFLSH